jgi:hypothetical protein
LGARPSGCCRRLDYLRIRTLTVTTPKTLAAAAGNRCTAVRITEVNGMSGVTFFAKGAVTVAELIEKLSALPDKTARVVNSAGPWDGLNDLRVGEQPSAEVVGGSGL